MSEELVYEERLSKNTLTFIRTLSYAIAFKDKLTWVHSLGVSRCSIMIGTQIGLPKTQIQLLRIGSLLHDIGKIGVPDGILLKPIKLTDKEYAIVRKHPEIGAKILGHSCSLKSIIPMILYHHERYDGSGYPYGLIGESIPIFARIVAVADSFDAMTACRTYHNPLSVQEAVKELRLHSGTQFDPRIVNLLIDALKEKNPLESFSR